MKSTIQCCAWVQTPGPEATIEYREIEVPQPGPDEVLVKLEVSGVCHSDCHSINGNTPMSTHIAGHEGIGEVVQVGRNDLSDLLGIRVGVSWLNRACGQCEICEVDYTHCPNQNNSGRNVAGTFQEYTVAAAAFVSRIPDGLTSELAAPLLCGGITMYGALRKANLKPNDYVLIPGAGGGLGHLGLQMAVNMGYKVIAVDGGAGKRELCMKLGATHFLDFTTDDIRARVHEITTFGVHAVVCVTGSASAYDSALGLLRNCGTLVCVGIPPSPYRLALSPFELLVRGIKVIGTSVGTREQMEELLQVAVMGKIIPHIETFPFTKIHEALKRLENNSILGRAVVKIS